MLWVTLLTPEYWPQKNAKMGREFEPRMTRMDTDGGKAGTEANEGNEDNIEPGEF